MRVFLSVLVVLLSQVVVAQSAPAGTSKPLEDPASREQVMEYLQIMNMRKQFDAMVPIMQQQLKKSSSSIQEEYPDLDQEDAEFIANEQQAMITGLFKRIDVPQLEEALIPVYQHHFTRPEMDAILIFYESPVGRKMLADLPATMGEVMQITQSHMEPIMKDLLRDFRAHMEQHVAQKKARQAGSQP